MTDPEVLPRQGDSGPIAYLTSEYPKVSHTFIQREMAALRALGLTIEACSVRRPPAAQIGADQHEEAARTFCILDVAARAPHRLAGAHLRLLARAPGRWGRALRLAWSIRPPGAKAALWHLFYLAEAGLLADHLGRVGARHIHNHFGNSSCTVAMLAAVLADLPFSFTVHGPDEFFRPHELALPEKIARARFVVAISHFCRSQLMLFSDPGHWDRLAIVHCGIDPARYGQGPRREVGQRLLFVGRLAPEKGVFLLLEGFARARAAHPGARLTVVGDGPQRAALEARARELGVAEAVTFTGFRTQDEVARHLEEADMLVLPSFAEGVPVVLMEAMAARIPTIASRIAGVPELVGDGATGFVVPPGDLEALADRIGRLLSDPDLCQRMGDAGRRVVEAEFSAGREAERLAILFRGEGVESPSPPGLGLTPGAVPGTGGQGSGATEA